MSDRQEAEKIVREYVEHDLDETWNGDTEVVIMNMPPDGLIERVESALSAARAEQREKDARTCDEIEPLYNNGIASQCAAAIRRSGGRAPQI